MPLCRAEPSSGEDGSKTGGLEVVELSRNGRQAHGTGMVGGGKGGESFFRPASKLPEICSGGDGQGLKGQIYLGGEDFLRRMQDLVEGKAAYGIARAQTKPLCPTVDQIVATVGQAYGVPASQVLDRSHVESYWLAVYLMRRAGNLSLQEVAERFGVSAARISQIQTKIERGQASAKMALVLREYKLKD